MLAFMLLNALECSFQCRVAFGLIRTKIAVHVCCVWHEASSSEELRTLKSSFFLFFYFFIFNLHRHVDNSAIKFN